MTYAAVRGDALNYRDIIDELRAISLKYNLLAFLSELE
jgi:hypothetical protein